MKKLIPQFIKLKIKKILGFPIPYTFHPSSFINSQSVNFENNGKNIKIVSDGTTPLYDTIYEIIDFDAYQLKSINFSNYNNETINFVDIGANIGCTSLFFSTFDNSEIFSFEPFAQNVNFLNLNVINNSLTNIKVFNQAVSDIDGYIYFEANTLSVDGSTTKLLNKSKNSIKVECISINTFINKEFNEKKLHLLKIDCEGGEYDILSSLRKEHFDKILNITLEVHDINEVHNINFIKNILLKNGYTLMYKPDPFGRRGLHHLLAKK
jgi:FkbM family methyltransferase